MLIIEDLLPAFYLSEERSSSLDNKPAGDGRSDRYLLSTFPTEYSTGLWKKEPQHMLPLIRRKRRHSG